MVAKTTKTKITKTVNNKKEIYNNPVYRIMGSDDLCRFYAICVRLQIARLAEKAVDCTRCGLVTAPGILNMQGAV